MPSEDRLPWFAFNPSIWLSDIRVQRMSYEAQGVYITLLAYMWSNSDDQCSITSEMKTLRRVLKTNTQRLRRVIAEIQFEGDEIFLEHDSRFYSKRLQAMKAQLDTKKTKASEAGKRGADARWGSHSDRNATAMRFDATKSKREIKTKRLDDINAPAPSLVQMATGLSMPNSPDTIRRYLASWVARTSDKEVRRILSLPSVQGLDVIEIHRQHFETQTSEPDAAALVAAAMRQENPNG